MILDTSRLLTLIYHKRRSMTLDDLVYTVWSLHQDMDSGEDGVIGIGWKWQISSDLMFWPNMGILAPLRSSAGAITSFDADWPIDEMILCKPNIHSLPGSETLQSLGV